MEQNQYSSTVPENRPRDCIAETCLSLMTGVRYCIVGYVIPLPDFPTDELLRLDA